MYNKKTAVFFTDDAKKDMTEIVRQEFASKTDRVGLLVTYENLTSTFIKKILDKYLSPTFLLRRKINFLRQKFAANNCEKILKPQKKILGFRNKVNKRVENVLSRYNPEVAVVTDYRLLIAVADAISVLGKATKLVVICCEFVIDKRLISTAVDLYVVNNDEMKNCLLENGIVEEKIKIIDLPIEKKYFQVTEYESATKKLNVDNTKNTLLISASKAGDDRFLEILEALYNANQNINVIAACGSNRELLTKARDFGFNAYNESLDMNFALTVSDAVLTRPTTMLLQQAKAKGKKIFTVLSGNKLEEKNESFFAINDSEIVTKDNFIAKLNIFWDSYVKKEEKVIANYTLDGDDAEYKESLEKAEDCAVDSTATEQTIEQIMATFM